MTERLTHLRFYDIAKEPNGLQPTNSRRTLYPPLNLTALEIRSQALHLTAESADETLFANSHVNVRAILHARDSLPHRKCSWMQYSPLIRMGSLLSFDGPKQTSSRPSAPPQVALCRLHSPRLALGWLRTTQPTRDHLTIVETGTRISALVGIPMGDFRLHDGS